MKKLHEGIGYMNFTVSELVKVHQEEKEKYPLKNAVLQLVEFIRLLFGHDGFLQFKELYTPRL